MPDDERFGGTHSSADDSNGYGRRHRRAEEPPEKPRRRRRSMEDGSGGLSVADLVQRHNNSRQDLSPVNPDSHARRAMPTGGQRRPVEGQSGRSSGRRPEETTGGPEWPDQSPNSTQYNEGPGHHAAPPATGRRALPDPQGFPPAEPPGFPPQPPAVGRRVTPDDLHFADPLTPDPHGGHHGMPDGAYGQPHAAPNDFGPMPDDRFGQHGMPNEGFGPAGRPDLPPGQLTSGRPVPPSPGQTSGSYRVPPSPGQTSDRYPIPPSPGQSPGGRALPPGRATGHHAMPDDGYGPPAGFGPGGAMPPGDFGPGAMSDDGFGPAPGGFGPGGGMPPGDFGPGADDGFGPGNGEFDPGPRPDEGFRQRPASNGFGPGQGTGQRPMPENGFGPPGPGSGPHPIPPGPGQATGGFGPGQGSGYRAIPGPAPRQPSGELAGPPPGRPAGPPPGGPGQGGEPMPDDRHGGGPVPSSRTGAEERPGQRSMPRRPSEPGARNPAVPLPPPREPQQQDAISMTTEMEAIGEDVQKRRGIDHTLARFSAVHDEIQAEERVRKAKRRKLMPWRQDDDEMDRLDDMVAMQTIAVPQKQPQNQTQNQPPNQPPARPEPAPTELAMVPAGVGQARLQETKTRRQTRSTLAIRVFAATAAILVFVATGIAWGFKSWVDASSQQVDALDPNSDAIQDAAGQRGDENFLLVGSDTRAGAEAEDKVGNEDEVLGARSDTVMIAHIPKGRERAVVVSFPRDLEVRRPACEGWDPKSGDYTGEQKPAEDRAKLNTAYQTGGPKCVTKTVQQLSGIMINHFVGIDFHGFKGMVDAVHGVEVCVDKPLKDDVLGTVVPEAGKNVRLSGDEALNFVRARHVQGDLTSDYGRIKRQQRFLSSLLRKAMSTEVLLDPGKLTNFVQAFSESTFGDNIGVDQMITLGQSLQGVDAGQVTFITVPTVGEANDRGNEDLRVDDTKSLFTAIRKNTPLPGEKSGTQQLQSGLAAQPSGPVDPKTIKLQVLNGGNPTGGIAGNTADQLAAQGYQIVWVDASPDKVKNTIIKYAKGREAAAQTLKSSVPDAELVEDPSMAGAVQLVIGPGFDGKVVAPGKGGGGKPAAPLPDDLSTINGSDGSCV